MVFLVLVAGEAGVTGNDLPCVRCVASGARRRRMSIDFMQASGTRVAGLAMDHRYDFRLLKMACFTSHLHHRSRSIDSMAGDAVQRRSIACPMAKAAEDPFVGSFERPGVPGLRARGGSRSEGEERSPLWHRVAHRARTREHLSRLVYMVVIVTPEAPGPVAVANIVWVSCPVHIHCGKDVTTIYGENRVDCLCDLISLMFEDVWVILGVISFDEQTHVVLDFISILVILDQCIQGKLLDPGQSV